MSNAKEIQLPRNTLTKVARIMGISRQAVLSAWVNQRHDVVEVVERVVLEFLEKKMDTEKRLNRISEYTVRPSKVVETENSAEYDLFMKERDTK